MEYDPDQFHVFDPEEIEEDHFAKITYRGAPFIVKPGIECDYRETLSIPDTLFAWFDQFHKDGLQMFHDASKDWFEEPLSIEELTSSFIHPLKEAFHCADAPDRFVPMFHIKGIRFNNSQFFWVIEVTRDETLRQHESDELSEFNVEVDDLPVVDLHLDKLSIYKVYEFLNQKVKESMADEIRGIFTSKKIKSVLDFSEVFDDEEAE